MSFYIRNKKSVEICIISELFKLSYKFGHSSQGYTLDGAKVTFDCNNKYDDNNHVCTALNINNLKKVTMFAPTENEIDILNHCKLL